MVSWVPHIVLPTLVALAFFRTWPRAWVMGWAPLVWLQDLDYLSPGEHRVYSHNIFVPLAPLVALLVLWRRQAGRVPEPLRFWAYAVQPGRPVSLLLASYFLASHVFLDLFAGGVVLFWPLLDQNLFLDYEIYLDTSTNTFEGAGEIGSSQGAPALAPLYTWLSYVDTATLAFLGAVALVALGLWVRRRRSARLRGPSTNDKTRRGVKLP
ncbi:MAG TPA: hypothetical protein VM286_10510 [Candidatus Thermoplasmatota archaeon]|nr:hypothetical protein [Candidatus Thermoplasmatota archaeon]